MATCPVTSLDVKKFAWGVLWMVFVLSACSTPTPTAILATDTPTQPVATDTPTLTLTPMPTDPPTITPSPSVTSSPAPTSTETPSPTATPEPLVATILENNTNIYDGPGTNYNYLATYSKDLKLQVVGRNEDGNWLVVWLPGGKDAWVALEKVKFESEVRSLSVYKMPPTPFPTITPLPIPLIVIYKDCPCPYDIKAVFFGFNNFNPKEFVNLEVLFEDGTVIATWNGRASENGEGSGSIPNDEFSFTGIYTFNLYGAEGSFAQATYSHRAPSESDE